MTDDRVQTSEQMSDLLANYRRVASDHWGTALFCRHGLHRQAPCEDCYDESLEGGDDVTPDPETPVPEPEPDEPTIG